MRVNLRATRGLGLTLTPDLLPPCVCPHVHNKSSARGEHRPFEWGRRVCGGWSYAMGVARCGRSAVNMLAVCVVGTLWG